eukprot:TRINITY_DN863_c0_g1_i3.p1 TRINITY_DN863_c0_g1~~TRINITY_DN863_c0_g1_i3.p1  ORF type:complete len:165 (-),score=37.09 TRINITY_DN863_c0_g1_i3:647-1141(-)
MGACQGATNKVDQKSFERGRGLDRVLRTNKDHSVKLLLLGTGDSGKSTFAKQMKMIHKNGFSHTEKKFYRGVLRDNVLQIAQETLGFAELEEESFLSSIQAHYDVIMECSDLMETGVADAIRAVWADKKYKRFVSKRVNDIQIPSSYELLRIPQCINSLVSLKT